MCYEPCKFGKKIGKHSGVPRNLSESCYDLDKLLVPADRKIHTGAGTRSHAIDGCLPAYVTADLAERLQIADSVFQLTNGFFDAREGADYLKDIGCGTSE